MSRQSSFSSRTFLNGGAAAVPPPKIARRYPKSPVDPDTGRPSTGPALSDSTTLLNPSGKHQQLQPIHRAESLPRPSSATSPPSTSLGVSEGFALTRAAPLPSDKQPPALLQLSRPALVGPPARALSSSRQSSASSLSDSSDTLTRGSGDASSFPRERYIRNPPPPPAVDQAAIDDARAAAGAAERERLQRLFSQALQLPASQSAASSDSLNSPSVSHTTVASADGIPTTPTASSERLCGSVSLPPERTNLLANAEYLAGVAADLDSASEAEMDALLLHFAGASSSVVSVVP